MKKFNAFLLTALAAAIVFAGTAAASSGRSAVMIVYADGAVCTADDSPALPAEESATPLPADAKVLITLAGTAGGDTGILRVYKKNDASGEGYDGSDGSLWDLRLTAAAKYGKAGLYKQAEGDNKTPVGIFRMNTPFGISEKLEGFPDEYITVGESLYWNGDSDSPLYNKLVDADDYTDFDRSESEHLIDYAGYYNYAIDSGYNAEGTPMKGSAIFLHCMVNDESTHGCIAVPEADMIEIMRLYEAGSTYILIYDAGNT